MSALYRTVDGDVVDAICARILGATEDVTEAVFDANPGLADHGPILPAGLVLQLPAAPTPATPVTRRLWD